MPPLKTNPTKNWLSLQMMAMLFIYALGISNSGCVNSTLKPEPAIAQEKPANHNTTTTAKMKVEIWSDIMCPFCYIGKRKFEAALGKFPHKNEVEIEWKSYQLDPSIPENTDGSENIYQYLAERKHISYEQSMKMHENVTQMAKQVGLQYNFDKAKIANSFKAHRVIQFAKSKGLGDKIEERFFLAYFTQGKNMADAAVLTELGKEIGLTEAEVKEALTNETYSTRVKQEVREGQSLGLTGVPFFVFNRKSAVSGAQQPETFLQALEKSYADWKKAQPALQTK